MKRMWILACILLVSLACSLSAPTPIAWSGTPTAKAQNATSTAFSLTQAAEMTAMPTLPVAITLTPTPMAATPTTQLTSTGPWLVFPAHDGARLAAYDIKTGTLLSLALPPLVNLNDLENGLSNDGKHLLVRAGSIENLNELAMYLLSDPNQPAEKITPLLSLYMQRQVVNEAGKRPARALSAVIADGGMDWSADDRQVVMSLTLDADSSDLYLWDATQDKLERLTGKYANEFSPQWSPKDNWVIFQEVEGLEEGLWQYSAISAFRIPRYDETRFLYQPPVQTSQEYFLGWANAITLISYSCNADYCQSLRQVDLENVVNRSIYLGAFSEVSFVPEAYALALLVNQNAGLKSGTSTGVYLSSSQGAPFNQIMAGDYSDLEWSEAGKVFFVRGTMGLTGIRLDNSSFTLDKETNALFSPGGAWLVGWNSGETNSGLRLYSASGSLLQSISSEAVKKVIWQKDDRGFMMVTESGLFQVNFPGLQPKLITEDIYQADALDMVWLDP